MADVIKRNKRKTSDAQKAATSENLKGLKEHGIEYLKPSSDFNRRREAEEVRSRA